ncbi:MAG: VWA domain-containing protein [Phycisphaerales bacterium]|nr:VWA domain-containing protein [Phycisphaerales bacterium]
MIFHRPSVWLLFLLVLVPLVWLRWSRPRRRVAVRFSDITALESAGRSLVVRLRWVVPFVRTLAMVLLIVALARPQKPNETSRVFTEGIAIQLVVDRSASMRAVDFQLEGRPADRLQAVKSVVREFVLGARSLPGRPDDLIGGIVFAQYADSACPLTLDHEHLVDVIDRTEIALDRSEGGTAIGDAIALGVERLHSLDERPDLRTDHVIRSKVMILLTDGENNAGDLAPETAADMAAALGIKIYTIGAGSLNATAMIPVMDPFGREVPQQVRVSIDEDTLRSIAARTGGAYFRATDTDSLRDIYARIDALEKTKVEQRRYLEFTEAALDRVTIGGVTLPALLPVVFVLLAAEVLLVATRFQTVP